MVPGPRETGAKQNRYSHGQIPQENENYITRIAAMRRSINAKELLTEFLIMVSWQGCPISRENTKRGSTASLVVIQQHTLTITTYMLHWNRLIIAIETLYVRSQLIAVPRSSRVVLAPRGVQTRRGAARSSPLTDSTSRQDHLRAVEIASVNQFRIWCEFPFCNFLVQLLGLAVGFATSSGRG